MQVTVHRKNQGMLLSPAFLTWNCCACPASSWRVVRSESKQQQKHTEKTTRSNIKRVRQRKQRKFCKIWCASSIEPCTRQLQLVQAAPAGGETGFSTGECYRGKSFSMKTKSVLQYFDCSVGHKDDF